MSIAKQFCIDCLVVEPNDFAAGYQTAEGLATRKFLNINSLVLKILY